MITLAQHDDGAIVTVHAQPGARRNAVLGERAGALRVAVTAAPEKGKANTAIQDVLAEFLDCKTSQLSVISGARSRQKTILVQGASVSALGAIIAERLGAITKPR
jgi:uncharacterized protein (TIGR00251 family)